jgi:fatty acid synthase
MPLLRHFAVIGKNTYFSSFKLAYYSTEPLLIGSIKSNMGHAEPASGLASIAKIITAIQRGIIPPNLHFNEPNEYIEGLKEGTLKVVTGETPFPGGYIGVNSFGFGGSNTHVILRAPEPQKALPTPEQPKIPKVFFYSGRTKEAVEHIFENVKEHIDNLNLQQLLAIQVWIFNI